MWSVAKWVHNAEEAKNANTTEKALVHVDKDYFPNICSLMMIMVTIPVTSCEWSISLLRLVKLRLQSTRGAEQLNALTLTQCHRDITQGRLLMSLLNPIQEDFSCNYYRTFAKEGP